MSASDRNYPHLVFLPSGIGSLNPFLQLSLMASSHNFNSTFINIQPQASASNSALYSSFFSTHKEIELLDFEITTPSDSNSDINDPFIVHFKNINHSVLHGLMPILSYKPVTDIFSDFALVDTLSQILDNLNISLYILSTTSARFFATIAYLPFLMDQESHIFTDSSRTEIEIPGLEAIPKSSIPPAWMHDFSKNYLMRDYLLPNARSFSKVKGFLLNIFEWFEPEAVAAVVSGRVLNNLQPVIPIGPLQSCEASETSCVPWLDEQPDESVVYVDFGSREVMSKCQMRTLAEGLEACGYRYLWVIQDKVQELLSELFFRWNNKNGKIFEGRVNQEDVLAHPAIGGFVISCEWELVMYAAWHGVPMLAWPRHGDQRMNAETVEKSGLGISVEGWNWEGKKSLEGKDIAQLLNRIMGDFNIKRKAKIVKAKAREACEVSAKLRADFFSNLLKY